MREKGTVKWWILTRPKGSDSFSANRVRMFSCIFRPFNPMDTNRWMKVARVEFEVTRGPKGLQASNVEAVAG